MLQTHISRDLDVGLKFCVSEYVVLVNAQFIPVANLNVLIASTADQLQKIINGCSGLPTSSRKLTALSAPFKRCLGLFITYESVCRREAHSEHFGETL